MHKIAVLGDRESVCGFACLGIDTAVVSDEEQARSEFLRLVKENYGIIYITEFCAEFLREEISLYSDLVTPSVILIPGVRGNTGEGMKNIAKSVERAVGSLILD